jgi:hypothetical protein
MSLLVLALSTFAVPSAHAMPELSLMSGVSLFSPSYSHANLPSVLTVSEEGAVGHAYGGSLCFDLGSFLGLEVGALRVARQFTQSLVSTQSGFTFDVDTEYRFQAWQFPLLIRLRPSTNFSIGVGGYATLGSGKVRGMTLGTLNGSVFSDGSEGTFTDQNLKGRDFGLAGSVSLALPLGAADLFVDGRYLLGLTEQLLDATASPGGSANGVSASGSTASFKNREIQVLIGLRFFADSGRSAY